MGLAIEVEAPPLKADKHGVIRVARTRVTLDTLIGFYNQGYSVKKLAESFDSVSLSDIHATIAYYLKHKAAVDRYIAEGDAKAAKVRKEIESQPGYKEKMQDLKKRMEAARKQRA